MRLNIRRVNALFVESKKNGNDKLNKMFWRTIKAFIFLNNSFWISLLLSVILSEKKVWCFKCSFHLKLTRVMSLWWHWASDIEVMFSPPDHWHESTIIVVDPLNPYCHLSRHNNNNLISCTIQLSFNRHNNNQINTEIARSTIDFLM